LPELPELPDEFNPPSSPEKPLEDPDELAPLPKGAVDVPPDPPQPATVSKADEHNAIRRPDVLMGRLLAAGGCGDARGALAICVPLG
jgi:hypothetical protein